VQLTPNGRLAAEPALIEGTASMKGVQLMQGAIAALSPSDNVAVKLRVQLKPNGRLAAEPALIEGTASMKGVQLMQGAIAALSACQPYAMLPADRYGEWKVLDLSFTPHDFNS